MCQVLGIQQEDSPGSHRAFFFIKTENEGSDNNNLGVKNGTPWKWREKMRKVVQRWNWKSWGCRNVLGKIRLLHEPPKSKSFPFLPRHLLPLSSHVFYFYFYLELREKRIQYPWTTWSELRGSTYMWIVFNKYRKCSFSSLWLLE